jgi:site-specific DNA-cytosine methylase
MSCVLPDVLLQVLDAHQPGPLHCRLSCDVSAAGGRREEGLLPMSAQDTPETCRCHVWRVRQNGTVDTIVCAWVEKPFLHPHQLVSGAARREGSRAGVTETAAQPFQSTWLGLRGHRAVSGGGWETSGEVQMTIGSLFSGIGGLEKGLEWAGLGPVKWQVEREEFCRKVLAKHWPDVARYEDVCSVGAKELEPVDIVCGGFPCQDISTAGRRAGLAGHRSGLWFEYSRIVRELRPRFVVVENVAALINLGLDTVLGDLASLGYDAWWDCLRPTSVRRIGESESSSWPTPEASCGNGGRQRSPEAIARGKQISLEQTVRSHWPTPTVSGNYNREGASKHSGDGLATAVSRSLSPDWTESLMGFQVGWTDIGQQAEAKINTPGSRPARRRKFRSGERGSKP